MKYLVGILLLMISAFAVDASEPIADVSIPASSINGDFGEHLGYITIMNKDGEGGIYIYSSDDMTSILSINNADLQSMLTDYLPGKLIASDDTGDNALYELDNGRYQMRLTTPNGQLDFSYAGNTPGSVRSAEETVVLDDEIVLKQTDDEAYRVLLLTTGEIAVRMGPDTDGVIYEVILKNAEDQTAEFRMWNLEDSPTSE